MNDIDDPEARLAFIKNSISGNLPEAAAKAAFGQLLELQDIFDGLKTRNLQLQSRLGLKKVKKTVSYGVCKPYFQMN